MTKAAYGTNGCHSSTGIFVKVIWPVDGCPEVENLRSRLNAVASDLPFKRKPNLAGTLGVNSDDELSPVPKNKPAIDPPKNVVSPY
jgi:hypothetical protein